MAKRGERGGGKGSGDDARPRGLRSRAVGEIMPDVGRAAFRRFGFVQSAVVSRWGEIVGPNYARVSTPESIRFPAGKRADGLLTLAGREFVTRKITDAVARIKLRQGMARRAPAPIPPPPGLRSAPIELGDSLRTIADPELRACLEALAEGVGRTSGAPAIALAVGKIA